MAETIWTRDEHNNFASKMERRLAQFKVAMAAAFIILASANVAGIYLINQQSNRNTAAFCAQRASLIQSNNDARKYLEDVEAGKRKPIPGIENREIVQSIRNRDNLIRALDVIHCPPV